LFSKWNIGEVVKVIIIFSSSLLLLFILLWLLSLSSILRSLSFISSLLVVLLFLELLSSLRGLLLVHKLGLGNWVMRRWQGSGHLEHLSSTFAIGSGDDWSVNVQESSLLEESVGGESQVVSHSNHSSESVGPRSQMSLFSQSLQK
jgi:hypothetical protein